VAEQRDAEIRVFVFFADVALELRRRQEGVQLRDGVVGVRIGLVGRVWLVGMRGKPDICVARSSRVICLPPRDGTVTVAGRYFATGSLSATSPLRTMSASSVAVNTLVAEPISNTVLASTGAPPSAILP
jgi:hypothetical protein